jgi:hypothetical protein
MKRHTPPLQLHPPKLGCGHVLQSTSVTQEAGQAAASGLPSPERPSVGASVAPSVAGAKHAHPAYTRCQVPPVHWKPPPQQMLVP